MDPRMVSVVGEYEQWLKTDPVKADRASLESAVPYLRQQLTGFSLDEETVHLAEKLYFHLGDKEAIVELLSRYLEQPLRVEEEARARWELIDNLAMLRRCNEVVEMQLEFHAWSKEHLPRDRLLWVMSDGTQALCWMQAGRADEWFGIVDALFRDVPRTVENRHERFYLLRTSGMLANRTEKNPMRVLSIARQLHDLCDEDPHWEKGAPVRLGACCLEVEVFHKLHDAEGVARAAALGTHLLASCAPDLPSLSTMYHNLATSLYRTRQYHLSIPMHRRAIELGTSSEHAYLWLAAALWATTRDRAQVLSLLREGAPRCRGDWYSVQEVPEFHDVVDDPDFLAAVK